MRPLVNIPRQQWERIRDLIPEEWLLSKQIAERIGRPDWRNVMLGLKFAETTNQIETRYTRGIRNVSDSIPMYRKKTRLQSK